MILLKKVINSILPPRCAISGEVVEHQGMLSPSIWGNLNFIADPMCAVCGVPFDFDMGEQKDSPRAVCAQCLKTPPIYQSARAPLIYDDGSRDLILSYKHGDQTQHVVTFLPWLQRAGAGMLQQADYLIPIPLHRWRLFSRRFNQSALVVNVLAKAMNKTALLDTLVRVRATTPQGHLDSMARKRNVRKAFGVRGKFASLLKGRHVVLVDDVLTTGATVEECTKVLLKAGVKRVDVLTVARAVKR